jgi:hypothetical protein
VNGNAASVADLWDGQDLKCTFKRTMSASLGRTWLDIVQLASTITLIEEEDSHIWNFTSNGTYTSQSPYKIINFRGVKLVYTASVWDLKIPTRVHFFLWLLSKFKVLARANFAKRQKVENMTCLFSEELELCQHLFFNCVAAREMWKRVSSVLGRDIGSSFDHCQYY